LKTRRLVTITLGKVMREGQDENKMGWVELEDEMQSFTEQKAAAVFRQGKQVLQVSSYLSMLEAIETGLFMGMIPLAYLKQRPFLKVIGSTSSIVRREVWVLMKESYLADPLLRDFLKRLTEGFRKFGHELG
jgi:DNA-binding transcriptional LysR family regulator